jgi:hypothetical protein
MTFNQYHTQIKSDERYKKLKFAPDGREHYVYRVTDYTRTENQHYYGSHTPPKNKKYKSLIDEFWTYRTSSNKNVLNENTKDNYKVKILKVFDNPAMKMIYESYLHQYFGVKNNDSFWNGSNQTAYGFDTTGTEGPNKNKPMSLSTREKLRKINLGKKHSTETKEKMSITRTGHFTSEFTKNKIGIANSKKIRTEEEKQHLREINLGKKHSTETKKKISKSMVGVNLNKKYSRVCCLVCNKEIASNRISVHYKCLH